MEINEWVVWLKNGKPGKSSIKDRIPDKAGKLAETL